MRKQLFLGIILAINFTINAQEYAMNTNVNLNQNLDENIISIPEKPAIENNTYTYKSHGDNVLVVFDNKNHIEYFNNKEHFIKSTISWVSKNECYMTLQESNLPNFPFRQGTKLHMKITKKKRGYIYYESTLGGRTWTGKMKENK